MKKNRGHLNLFRYLCVLFYGKASERGANNIKQKGNRR